MFDAGGPNLSTRASPTPGLSLSPHDPRSPVVRERPHLPMMSPGGDFRGDARAPLSGHPPGSAGGPGATSSSAASSAGGTHGAKRSAANEPPGPPRPRVARRANDPVPGSMQSAFRGGLSGPMNRRTRAPNAPESAGAAAADKGGGAPARDKGKAREPGPILQAPASASGHAPLHPSLQLMPSDGWPGMEQARLASLDTAYGRRSSELPPSALPEAGPSNRPAASRSGTSAIGNRPQSAAPPSGSGEPPSQQPEIPPDRQGSLEAATARVQTFAQSKKIGKLAPRTMARFEEELSSLNNSGKTPIDPEAARAFYANRAASKKALPAQLTAANTEYREKRAREDRLGAGQASAYDMARYAERRAIPRNPPQNAVSPSEGTVLTPTGVQWVRQQHDLGHSRDSIAAALTTLTTYARAQQLVREILDQPRPGT